MQMEQIPSSEEIHKENEALARFLYKQYKMKKLEESLLKQRESVE